MASRNRRRFLKQALAGGTGLVLVLLVIAPTAARAQSGDAGAGRACADLGGVDLVDVGGAGSRVTSATEASSRGAAVCAVEGVLAPTIGFKVQLPLQAWNGRYLQVGCGGLCGRASLEVGAADGCAPLEAGGFAIASTDMGHQGMGGEFGQDPRKREDFAHRGVHLTAVASKKLIRAFYGRDAAHAYFTGCSDGGREALVEAQRYPGDFDGIVAGAPAMNFQVQNSLYHAWQARSNTAADGKAILAASRLPLVHRAVLAECDGKDGQVDGLIADPRACRFEPAALLCRANPSEPAADCLTAAEVEAVRRLYDGPRDAATGERLTIGGPQPGSELAWAGVFVPRTADQPIFSERIALDALRNLVFERNPPAGFGLGDLRFDRATFDRLRPLHPLYDATDPDLSAFAGRGGKLILWHGWADPHISPINTIAYHEAVERALGRQRTGGFERLYLLPGVYHCSGGEGPSVIDLLTPLLDWVERGVAPDAVVARPPAGGNRSRPVYPYPSLARYAGRGDPNDAASYGRAAPRVSAASPDWAGSDFYRPRTAIASPPVASARVVAAAAPVAPLFKSDTYRSGGSVLPYRYFAPGGPQAASAKRPLVLFLHGEEARGRDNLAQLTSSEGATIWVERDHLAKNPTYVLAPQAPPGADWGRDPVYRDTVALLKQFLAGHPDVDPDRLYVVGFSMGGTGAWTMLLRNPGLFAAAIPISGNANAFLPDAKAFAGIRNTPVLPVHSLDDPVSPVSGTQNAVDAMVAAGDQSVGFNSQIWGLGAVLPAHEAWRPAFHDYEVVYNWLFEQSLSRTNRGTVAPSSLYTLRDLGGGVAQIWDYYLGTVYVIERPDKALVIDTGMGTGNLYEFIRQHVLRNKDVDLEIAVTHDHFDHVSGLSSFVGVPQLKKVHVHPEDAELVKRLLKGDAGKVHFVADGDEVPLGGGTVGVIHVPGHTFGSLVYSYENNLYTGDAVGSGDLWMGFTPMSIEEYLGSLGHLLDRVGDRPLAILSGHTGEFRSPLGTAYLRQLLACASGLVDGSLHGTPYRRTVGGQVSLGLAATVGRATIVHDPNNVRATKGALRSLGIGAGSLSSSFRPFRFFYSASVGPDVAVATLTPVALARDSRGVSVNGTKVEKGAAYEATLQPGRNAFSIVVTAADGAETRYELAVNRGR